MEKLYRQLKMRTGKSDMIPSNQNELHDLVMAASDDIFIALREQFAALDEAIGSCNFAEIRDGNAPNTFSVVLLLETLTQCMEVREYADLIIKAHQIIDSSVLESFQIIYQMPAFRSRTYSEQLFFIHNF
jgi:hypothetical protein